MKKTLDRNQMIRYIFSVNISQSHDQVMNGLKTPLQKRGESRTMKKAVLLLSLCVTAGYAVRKTMRELDNLVLSDWNPESSC